MRGTRDSKVSCRRPRLLTTRRTLRNVRRVGRLRAIAMHAVLPGVRGPRLIAKGNMPPLVPGGRLLGRFFAASRARLREGTAGTVPIVAFRSRERNPFAVRWSKVACTTWPSWADILLDKVL